MVIFLCSQLLSSAQKAKAFVLTASWPLINEHLKDMFSKRWLAKFKVPLESMNVLPNRLRTLTLTSSKTESS